MFENRAQRKMFVPTRYDVEGDREDYVTRNLYDLHSSTNTTLVIKSRRMRRAGHVTCMGEREDAYKALVGRHEGKRPRRTPKLRCEDNIKMDLQEVEGEAWTGWIWLRIETDGGLLSMG